MNIIGIIPARLKSKRFPNKVITELLELPMIIHVLKRAQMSNDLSDIYVATSDNEIKNIIEKHGGKVIKTFNEHDRALDRVAEAIRFIEEDNNTKVDIAVMIQPDEPLISPDMIGICISPLVISNTINITSLAAFITDNQNINNSNIVKIALDINNNALYFSRNPIPSQYNGANGVPYVKSIGVRAIRRKTLMDFSTSSSSPLEVAESISALRLLENGHKIKIVLTNEEVRSVDVKEDMEIVEKLLKNNYWSKKY